MGKKKISDYIKLHPKQLEALGWIGKGKKIFFGGSRGGGKALYINDLVATPFGFRAVKDIKVGDTICNPTGGKQTVIAVHPISEMDMYEVEFEDGATVKCNDEHLWSVRITSNGLKESDCDDIDNELKNFSVMTTAQMVEWFDKKEAAADNKTINKQHMVIPLTEPVIFTKSYKYDMRPIHPYVLGVLIGDGCLTIGSPNRVVYCGIDDEVDEKISSLGYDVKKHNTGLNKSIISDTLPVDLHRLKLNNKKAHEKHIPESYKYGTIEQRIELMQGLMDTDGYVDDRGHMSYTTISEQLAKDVQFVVRSLGGKATITSEIGNYKDKDGDKVICQRAYTVYFNTKINSQLVHLPRKKERALKGEKFNGGQSPLSRRITKITRVGKAEARCITVSAYHGLFITNDFIVTHNSHLSLAAAVLTAMQYPTIRIVIIRETFQELENNFISKLVDMYPEDVFGYKYYASRKTALFKNRSRIMFQALDSDKAAKKIQGVEYQFMIIDEANNFDEDLLQKITGSLRRTDKIVGFIPTLLQTGNPGGSADYYFKTRYITPDYSKWHPYELSSKDDYIFIPARVDDNYSLDKDNYIKTLGALNDDLRRAWLLGDWNVFEGKFFNEFSEHIHVIEPFPIPEHWYKVGGFDLGYTKKHPSVYLAAAQDPDTETLYLYDEWEGFGSVDDYGRQLEMIYHECPTDIIFADPSMWTVRKNYDTDEAPAEILMRYGLPLQRANNDRVNGWRIVRQWLHWDANLEGDLVRKPKLYIFSNCRNTIEFLPLLKYAKTQTGQKKEDCDTTMRDDEADALRYLLFNGFRYPVEQRFTETEEIEDKSIELDRYNEPIHNEDDDYLLY